MSKLLVVVDYQNDFVTGSLGFPEAVAIEKNIIELIKEFKANGDTVIFTMDTHQNDYLQTVEGQKLPIVHCIQNTEGWELTPEIQKYVGDSLVYKKDTFGSKQLGQYCENHMFDEIHLCGVVSDICVFCDAIIAKTFSSPYTKVYVRKDAVASTSNVTEERGFETLKYLHIEVI